MVLFGFLTILEIDESAKKSFFTYQMTDGIKSLSVIEGVKKRVFSDIAGGNIKWLFFVTLL
jgi:hypothetical protein